MAPPADESLARAASLLAGLARRVGASLALDETLDAAAEAVVDALGFGAAVVNLVEGDQLEVVAVAGSPEVREALLGTTASAASWAAVLGSAERWGRLLFLDHRAATPPGTSDMAWWRPPEDVTPWEESRWHPDDSLFAPLYDGKGDLIGVISVDLPVDGLRPTPSMCALLEAFAGVAATAIQHAREHEALVASESMLRRMFEDSPIGVALMGADGRFVRVNRALCNFLGRPAEEILAGGAGRYTHPEDASTSEMFERQLQGDAGRIYRVDKRYRHADGRVVWGRLSMTRLLTGNGVNVLAQVEDITDQRAAEEALRHQTLHDALTGLPNRTLAEDRIEQALAVARRDGTKVAVVFCDLDHFKLVNDSFGHHVGDRLLQHVSDSLRRHLRPNDTAARLSGDEFVLVLPGLEEQSAVVEIAKRLRAAVREPVTIDGVMLTPSLSMGVTVGAADAVAQQLLAEADSALYRAKALGRARVEVYDADLRRAAQRQLALRSELDRAVENREFGLYYQPIVDLTSGAVLGYEALLRWHHPERGIVAPGEFLDLLTECAHDDTVTDLVLEQACRDLSALAAVRSDPLFVSVNLSARQLSRPDLAERVASVLRRTAVAPDRLWIEVTEEHAIDKLNTQVLQQLRALGVHVALDDFGTGYAGLSYLRRLPADVVKIDREFVARVGDDATSRRITAAVTELGVLLGMTVVAEGVETPEQARVLSELGVATAQGFYFGRPAPLECWLESAPIALLPRQRVSLEETLSSLDRRLLVTQSAAGAADAVLDAATRATGADGAVLGVVEPGDMLRLLGWRGYPIGDIDAWHLFGLDADVPIAEAARCNRVVWLDQVDDSSILHEAAGRPPRTARFLGVPARTGDGTVIGSLVVSWRHGSVAPDDGRLLLAVGERFARWLTVHDEVSLVR